MAIKSNNSTQIVRVEKSSNFSVINNTCFRDDRLSFKAKGIMGYFLQLPDNWVINLNEIITHSTDGEKSFRAGLDELKKFGYVERNQVREGNKIVGWETVIKEVPTNVDNTLLAGFVQVQDVQVQKLQVQNEGLVSTYDIKHLDELNTYNIKDNAQIELDTDFDEFYSYYPKKVNKKKAKSSYIKARVENKKEKKPPYTKEHILNGLFGYLKYLKINNTELKFTKGPDVFLNGEHFNDEYDFTPAYSNNSYQQQQTMPWEVDAYGSSTSKSINVNDRNDVQKLLQY